MTNHAIYVDGRVRVQARQCKTCIFGPRNVIDPERIAGMVEDATSDPAGSIVCHSTLDQPLNAVCRGFCDLHATPALRLAAAVGVVLEVDP